MTTSETQYPSREPRFQVTRGQRISVRIEYGDGKSCQGELSDISCKGLRFLCAESLPRGTVVKLQISLTTLGIEVFREAEVAWTQAAVGSNLHCLHGAMLRHEVSNGIISSLASADVVERRRDNRIDVDITGTVRSELSQSLVPVQIVNYSAGGFCVRGRDVVSESGGRLMVGLNPNEAFPEPIRICGRIQWTRRDGDVYTAGCSFLSRQDFQNLRRYCDASSAPSAALTAVPAGARRSTRWALVTSAMLAILLTRLLLPGPAPQQIVAPTTAASPLSPPSSTAKE